MSIAWRIRDSQWNHDSQCRRLPSVAPAAGNGESQVAPRALLQNAVEHRVRQVRQICIATCRRMLEARNYMLRGEDGVHGGHWADSDLVAKLLACCIHEATVDR